MSDSQARLDMRLNIPEPIIWSGSKIEPSNPLRYGLIFGILNSVFWIAIEGLLDSTPDLWMLIVHSFIGCLYIYILCRFFYPVKGAQHADRGTGRDSGSTGTSDDSSVAFATALARSFAAAIGPRTRNISAAGYARTSDAGTSGTGTTEATGSEVEVEEKSPPRVLQGPVVGYRTWSISRGLFTSLLVGYSGWTWHTSDPSPALHMGWRGDMRDHQDQEGVPADGCTCGYYAWSDRSDIEGMTLPSLSDSGEETTFDSVIGIAIGWGRVAIHKHGWRAEYAKPIALILTPESDAFPYRKAFNDFTKAIAADTGLPALTLDQASAYVSEFYSYTSTPDTSETHTQDAQAGGMTGETPGQS